MRLWKELWIMCKTVMPQGFANSVHKVFNSREADEKSRKNWSCRLTKRIGFQEYALRRNRRGGVLTAARHPGIIKM